MNVRYIEPIDVFCDKLMCRPYRDDQVFYEDQGHLLPRGADELFDAFAGDFTWLAGGP